MMYYVFSRTSSDYCYKVNIWKESCTEDFYVLRQADCNVCIHTHTCTSIDNVVYLNICKHIHKVGSMESINE